MLLQEFSDQLMGKKCLVTGGTGLIGRQVVKLLCDAQAKVTIVSLDKLIVDERAEHLVLDLTDFTSCVKVMSGIDYVFHLAGIKGSIQVTKQYPASFFVPLLMFNTNVLESARQANVEKLIYTSSIGAYSSAEVFKEEQAFDGEPMDTYPGWAKRMAELQIQSYREQYGLEHYSVVRPCNVYGPGDNFDPENAMVIPTLMHRIANKEDPVSIWGDGTAVRDFAYSRDVAIGIIQTLIKGTGDQPFINLGSGIGYTIKELVQALNSFIEFNYEFDSSKPSGFPKRVMDISLAESLVGYEHKTSLVEGLKETWEWFLQNREEYLNKKNYFAEENK
ncbi:NAD-dependent epimerase/dehydratase family protein [Thalassotalea euphylliae]|uniref:NAD-dependent epimerase/dehydratase family protein n=1 Tax=Thalassotalea euphylliae TaxID=1655234 RepID=A0A3E0UD58_9GAMM|nr:NAD-dependent epimerase/dehydratase family protein [Thalassotalea euphylliae]REL34836.1 NAD-dependent epimerase/dehydratase family protein [Thalassotalea euphylliae]